MQLKRRRTIRKGYIKAILILLNHTHQTSDAYALIGTTVGHVVVALVVVIIGHITDKPPMQFLEFYQLNLMVGKDYHSGRGLF